MPSHNTNQMTSITQPKSQKTTAQIARYLRVNHAGERAAQTIYKGQLAVLGNHRVADEIRHMMDQEQEHLDIFDELLNQYQVRPSLLDPLWGVAGFALGAATAALGPKAAMACTIAVEEVIGTHYDNQVRALSRDNPRKAPHDRRDDPHDERRKNQRKSPQDEQHDASQDESYDEHREAPFEAPHDEQHDASHDDRYDDLINTLARLRDEELEHRDIAIEHEGREAKGYDLMQKIISVGCRTAIKIAEKL